jgi:lipoyl-dependent peroxiredoxin
MVHEVRDRCTIHSGFHELRIGDVFAGLALARAMDVAFSNVILTIGGGADVVTIALGGLVNAAYIDELLGRELKKLGTDAEVSLTFRWARFASGHDLLRFAAELGLELSGPPPRYRRRTRGTSAARRSLMKRTASARWTGGLKDGKGTIATGSGALTVKYGFTTRFEDAPGSNPEELIGAAHAGCFSMALSGQLAGAKLTADSIDTKATVTMEKLEAGWTITAIHLDVTAKIPGADAATLQTCAENAKKGCPISRLLKAEITMTAQLA